MELKEALDTVAEYLKVHNFRNISEDVLECHEKIKLANEDPNSLSSHKTGTAKAEDAKRATSQEATWTEVFWHYYPTYRDCFLIIAVTLLLVKVFL